ncbi:hypothetical protein QYE76_049328 [Lolium multiflorum]|uniref:Retrovirus-related Pol polyprotein from transposon TNT 1-94 n=1 Tax=Lolium multiflorum TaxID=4521 RepID=A0AAD8SP46_LOLMU|nr:hypothetical protein QYE76_049328 [Lolium multiflorum]
MSSLKFDQPQLDYTTRFSLWQVKMREILTQSSNLDEALDGFGKKDAKTWTDDEKRKDRKAFSLIQLHLSNNILQEVLSEKSSAALWLKLESICMSKDLTSKMHVKMKLFSHKLQEGASVMNHLSIFREIVADLLSMELRVFGCTAYAHVDNGKLEHRDVKNVVFNEVVMFYKSSSTDVFDAIDISDVPDDEQQRISVQVEHVEEKENDVAENDNTVVQHTPPVLQQTNNSIVADIPRRNKGPRPRLIKECNLVHHALSCAEQVDHDTEPATYAEVVASVDRVK